MTPEAAVDIARAELREAFFRVAGQVLDYELGIRAWIWALTEGLETTLDAAVAIRRGAIPATDPERLRESLALLAKARERYES